jgi:hypothetical protein
VTNKFGAYVARFPRRPKKSEGDASQPHFSIDGCGQNSRLLWVFKSMGVEDLTHVIISHADSAGLRLSPPFFSVSDMKTQANLPQPYNSVNCGGEVTGLDL